MRRRCVHNNATAIWAPTRADARGVRKIRRRTKRSNHHLRGDTFTRVPAINCLPFYARWDSISGTLCAMIVRTHARRPFLISRYYGCVGCCTGKSKCQRDTGISLLQRDTSATTYSFECKSGKQRRFVSNVIYLQNSRQITNFLNKKRKCWRIRIKAE